MTIQELYAEIGGDYEQAVKVMRMDKLIDRYIRKLRSSSVGDSLAEAGESMDATKLFESAHAMKGVCANLGLDTLASAADEVTEEFRPGNPRRLSDDEVRAKVDDITALFRKTVDTIRRYEEGV